MEINGHGFLAESSGILAVAAMMLSLVAGMALSDFAMQGFKRRSAVIATSANGKQDRLRLMLESGIRPLLPLSKWILGKSRIMEDSSQSAVMLLSEFGIRVSGCAVLSDLLAITFMSLLLATLIGGSVVFGISVACVVFIGSISFVRNRVAKQNISMREEIPDVLRNLVMSFRSGHSLPQVLRESSKECSGYLGYLFSVASDRMDMGATPSEALSIMKGNDRAPELSFVAVALDIQHKSGGSIALVLESAMRSIKDELKLSRSLRVQTAQAKLSASIVTIMPFILMALFSMFSPDFLSPFFSSAIGVMVLAIALAMQLMGVLIVRKMLNVGGD